MLRWFVLVLCLTGCKSGEVGGEGDPVGRQQGDPAGTSCDIDAAATPWPAWVPVWPGSGRNATGNTTFRFLDSGSTVTGLVTESVSATSAVVTWTTAGEADSSVAWGTTDGPCPVGYRRTGGRTQHRMLVAPLVPSTPYTVTVRSRDDEGEGRGSLSFTTGALPAVTEIDACGEITTPGAYRLTADISGDCTCLNVTANDVDLDLAWHTVTYAATETAAQCHGVRLAGDNNRVARGIVIQGAAGGDLYSHGLRGQSASNLTFEQMWVHVHTADAFGLRTMYSGDITVRDSVIVSDVTQVTDRHYPGNGAIQLDLDPSDAPASVYDNILFNFPHWGINLTGDTRLTARPATSAQIRHVYNNHLFADMHATNGYALGVHANHVAVHHNEVRPIYNGRALHYGGSDGVIHHNIIEALERIHGDPGAGYQDYSDIADPASSHYADDCSWVVAHTIRVEGGNFGSIHHNEVYGTTLPTTTFGATGLNINVAANGVGAGNDIHHNQFTAHQASGSYACPSGVPIRAGWIWGDATPVEINQLHDNVFRSNGVTLRIDDPAYATSANDTLESY